MTQARWMILALAVAGSAGCWRMPVERRSTAKTRAEVIDDKARLKRLEASAQAIAEAGKATPVTTLIEQLKRTECSLSLARSRRGRMTPAEVYAECVGSVVVLAGIYKCSRCPKWHIAVSSGFFITTRGALVTNHHVVSNKAMQHLVAMTYGGSIYPVKEVLAASEANDVAILQLDAPGVAFTPLPLVAGEPVGAPVTVISHPDSRLYTFSEGMVSRRFVHVRKGKPVDTLAITADFARGSSGAPVLNGRGAVVGFVGSTRSVYFKVTEGKKENLQMVFKHCVPSESVLKLIAQPK
ncbi:trypsin-like peptidase domain-containing protein [bacterium]|nr:trypsin-like peptidase domain-containing protein [bacterium]